MRFPVVESVLIADITIEARGKANRVVDFSRVLRGIGSDQPLAGGLMSRSHRYTVAGVTLARRTGLCTDSLLFFRNSNGEIGRDQCPPLKAIN
jgi:hypothetical protein